VSAVRRAETVIIGAGQAGLALSRWLTSAGHDHVLLERGRLAERWRSERWDSLALLTPDWANRLPGAPAPEDPDAFRAGAEFVADLERYAASFGAPVHEHTTVLRVEFGDGGEYRIQTDRTDWRARNVVLASGDCSVPSVPWFAPSAPPAVQQLHAAHYRSADALEQGGVLVVGSGPSGHQIAHELAAAGRRVVLAAGSHARIPRRYRGRDIWAWLHDIGHLSRRVEDMPSDPRKRAATALPLDGRGGGRTLDLGTLAHAGVTIAGRLTGFAGDHALFGDGLHRAIADADTRLRRLLSRIDAHIAARAGRDAVPPADVIAPLRLPAGPASLDLASETVRTIVWATGFRRHYPWLHVPGCGPDGDVAHERGVTALPGLFVLGQRWQHRMISHQIGGVGEDARHLAALIAGGALDAGADAA
jgi:putative flavoprotein involved in K+ transport